MIKPMKDIVLSTCELNTSVRSYEEAVIIVSNLRRDTFMKWTAIMLTYFKKNNGTRIDPCGTPSCTILLQYQEWYKSHT